MGADGRIYRTKAEQAALEARIQTEHGNTRQVAKRLGVSFHTVARARRLGRRPVTDEPRHGTALTEAFEAFRHERRKMERRQRVKPWKEIARADPVVIGTLMKPATFLDYDPVVDRGLVAEDWPPNRLQKLPKAVRQIIAIAALWGWHPRLYDDKTDEDAGRAHLHMFRSAYGAERADLVFRQNSYGGHWHYVSDESTALAVRHRRKSTVALSGVYDDAMWAALRAGEDRTTRHRCNPELPACPVCGAGPRS